LTKGRGDRVVKKRAAKKKKTKKNKITKIFIIRSNGGLRGTTYEPKSERGEEDNLYSVSIPRSKKRGDQRITTTHNLKKSWSRFKEKEGEASKEKNAKKEEKAAPFAGKRVE